MRGATLLVPLVVGCRPGADAEPPPTPPSIAVAPVEGEVAQESHGLGTPVDGGSEEHAEDERPAEREPPSGDEPDAPPSADEESPPGSNDIPPASLANATAPFERATLPAPEGEAKPSRIRPGEYECKISRGYRFRPCTVELDEHGRTILTIPQALVGLQGVLTDEGQWTRFDGIKTRDRPFGCFSCQERCTIDPGSCYCQEVPRVASAQCLLEPVRFRFRKKDGQWHGSIEHHHYYGDLDPDDGHPLFETERYVFVMRR